MFDFGDCFDTAVKFRIFILHFVLLILHFCSFTL